MPHIWGKGGILSNIRIFSGWRIGRASKLNLYLYLLLTSSSGVSIMLLSGAQLKPTCPTAELAVELTTRGAHPASWLSDSFAWIRTGTEGSLPRGLKFIKIALRFCACSFQRQVFQPFHPNWQTAVCLLISFYRKSCLSSFNWRWWLN